MRSIFLLVAGSILASCTNAPPMPVMRSPAGERTYQALFAGKIAQAPASCLPTYNAKDMTIIDGQTLAFRVGTGSGSAYLVRLSSGCEMLSSNPASYALLSRQPGGMGLCQGDIQQVMDTTNHVIAGSCTIEQIVPYVRP